MVLTVIELKAADQSLITAAAQLLVDGFRDSTPESWPTVESGLETVQDCVSAENICRAAVDESGQLLGWVGAQPTYDGHVWELHPLVVRPDSQRRGIGKALVADLESQVAMRGGLTMFLGTDDETGATTLADVDLYDDLPKRIATLKAIHAHPFEFYQRLGYTVIGVIPDANGRGKPDILIAKQITPRVSDPLD